MIDKREFERGMAVLAATYPQARVDPALTRAYFQILAPALSTAEFEQAVARVMATERFWPSPAVLLAAAGKGVSRAIDESAVRLEAQAKYEALWSIAEKTIQGASWRADRITDELGPCALSAFRAIGGQTRLRQLTVDAEHWAKRDFVTAYEDAARLKAAGLPLPTPADVRRLGPSSFTRVAALMPSPTPNPSPDSAA